MFKKRKSSLYFIWFIALICVLNIFDLILFEYQISTIGMVLNVATSIVGLIGVLSYRKKNSYFAYLIYAWILMQFIGLHAYGVSEGGVKYWYEIIRAKQFLELTFSHSFNFDGVGYKLIFNFMPAFYLYLFRSIELSSYEGRQFKVLEFLNDSSSFKCDDFSGRIISQVSLSEKKISFLIELDIVLEVDNQKRISHAVFSIQKGDKLALNTRCEGELRILNNAVLHGEEIVPSDNSYISWIGMELN